MDLKSATENLAPFRLEPKFVERIWGTSDLRPWYDFVSDGKADPVGEVWLTGDDCPVLTGPLTGLTLGQVFVGHSKAMMGDTAPASAQGASPLLLKVIFAREKLSVQVHPDDRLAQKYGQPRGKTECWYALAADPGAQVAAGLKPGVTLEAVEREVADGTLESSLEVLPVSAGDMIFVDAGTVHAIWPGSVLLETQQNCDITYRLFDYGRPRELHVAKALEAIRLVTDAGKETPLELVDRTVLVDRDYFCVEKMRVEGSRTGASMERTPLDRLTDKLLGKQLAGLQYLFAAAGSARVTSTDGKAFDSVELPTRGLIAVPASSPEWQIENMGGLDLDSDHSALASQRAFRVTDSMSGSSWRASLVAYIRAEAAPIDKFGHQPRLYALASRIAQGEDCDDDVLFAAAWMHDLGVFLGHRPSDPASLAAWDHVPYTIAKTRERLAEWGFPAHKLDAVAEAIRTHQPKDHAVLREAIVLRDADILEQLGAIGALRAFVKVGRDTRFATYSDVIPVLERARDQLPAKLRLPQSREIAKGRVQILASFFGIDPARGWRLTLLAVA